MVISVAATPALYYNYITLLCCVVFCSLTGGINMTKQKKLLFIIIGIGLLVYMGLPQLRDFRHSAYGSIVPLMIIGAVAFHLTFSPKIRMPLLGKITIWGFVILEILSCVLNLGKIEALFFYIYSIINILVTAYLYLKTGKK